MNKLLNHIIISITLFSSTIIYGEHPFVNAAYQSINSLKTESPKASNTKWVKVKESFGKEKISIEFPKKPTIKKKDGMLFADAKKDNVEYSFFAPKPPVEGVDSEILFDNMLYAITSSMLNADIQHSINIIDGHPTLEVWGFDPDDNKWSKMKVVVTDQNLYVYGIETPNGLNNPSHDRFFNSFTIQN